MAKKTIGERQATIEAPKVYHCRGKVPIGKDICIQSKGDATLESEARRFKGRNSNLRLLQSLAVNRLLQGP
jgi:hypothetical protein